MTPLRMLMRSLGVLGIAGLSVVGCSDPVREAQSTKQISERVIVNQLSNELGVGNLVAQCPEVVSPQLGSKYLCVATTEDDRVVNVEATVRADGRVEVQTTNVIRAEVLDRYETRAVQDLNGATGAKLVDTDLECGDQPVILSSAKQMVCGVNNKGAVHDITFTVSDVNKLEFDVEVARIPRA